jgi:hypothetical protein
VGLLLARLIDRLPQFQVYVFEIRKRSRPIVGGELGQQQILCRMCHARNPQEGCVDYLTTFATERSVPKSDER